MPYIRYTPEMIAWLREWYPRMGNAEVAERFEAEFGVRPSMTGMQTKCSKLGIRKPRKTWTAEEVEWFVSFVPGHSESEISAEHERLFGEPLTEGQIGSAKTRHGVKSGTVGGRFEKGNVPWTKGKSWAKQGRSEESCEASLRTCFKKGVLPHNAAGAYVGRERVDRDGYTWVQVSTGLQETANCNFRLKHRVEWERLNGPLPPSTMVVFADHDKGNFDPDNLVAVPRPVWSVIQRMGMAYHDRESLEACMMRARLHTAMASKRKELAK